MKSIQPYLSLQVIRLGKAHEQQCVSVSSSAADR
jgi:hypothetical protein